MVHMCIWCAYVGKKLFPNEDVAQLYVLDVLIDKIRKTDLQVKPTTVGYYEGCHLRAHHQTPGVKIDYAPYREMLAAVKGLEMVDIPKYLCCVHDLDRLLEQIEKKNVQTVVSPCPACVLRLRRALVGKVDVKSPQEILLEGLG